MVAVAADVVVGAVVDVTFRARIRWRPTLAGAVDGRAGKDREESRDPTVMLRQTGVFASGAARARDDAVLKLSAHGVRAISELRVATSLVRALAANDLRGRQGLAGVDWRRFASAVQERMPALARTARGARLALTTAIELVRHASCALIIRPGTGSLARWVRTAVCDGAGANAVQSTGA
jgi:hypothetical protein